MARKRQEQNKQPSRLDGGESPLQSDIETQVAELLSQAVKLGINHEQKRKHSGSEFVISAASGALNSLTHLLPGEIDGPTLATKVKEIAQSGDTTAIQEMLTSQALTLQAMFNYWVMVVGNTKDIETMQAMAHLALKSQEQCRKTLQTLADVKSPKKPSQFIKNYVAQQLNQLQMEQQPKEKISGTFSDHDPNELDQQKLLKDTGYAKVDPRSSEAASTINSNHEALGVLNGSCDR